MTGQQLGDGERSGQQMSESAPLSGVKPGCLRSLMRRLLPPRYWSEVREQCLVAGPVCLSQLMEYLISIVSSIFCGHLGKIELDAVTLAVATYGGKNLKRVGTILQRGILILMLFCFPCWAVFINTEHLLLLCGQNPDVARLTQTYVMIFIPALPAIFLYQLQIRYLQSQGIMWPQVITGLVVNLTNVAVNAIFIYGLNLGVLGGAWANTISHYALTGVLLGYIILRKLHLSTWGGWSRDCLQEWGAFVRLAIPSMLMVCIEWWSFEIGGFLAGIISVAELGAQAIILHLVTIAYQIPVGFGVAASVRIGNALGAGDVEQAKTSYTVTLLCIGFCALLTSSLMAALKNVIAYIFTNDREIAALVSRIMLIVAPFHLFDAVAGTCGGILRGAGKQKIGAITNAVGYYLLGLPIGISLMFAAKLGVVGLWCGMIFPIVLQVLVFISYILRMDWDKACEEAQVRAGVKSNKNHLELSILQLETSSTGFGMVANGDVQSFKSLYPVVAQDITGAVILPDAVYHENHSEHLVLEDESSELSNIVGEVLSAKQLILRRGLALCLAVFVLLAGVIIKILIGNG
ncbi:multidrug and toxin extrusion protein 2-like isoform X2 [Pseudophryne corroboree]|uniref:multidrug and toxin extrusion protein 2-like isoform X2 n=1 Tax=Pseudophryne corroboree TaxID=495146 RepID=UPI0030813EF2